MESLFLMVLVVALFIYISKTNTLAKRIDGLERELRDKTSTFLRTAAQLELEVRKLRGLVDQPQVDQPRAAVGPPPTPASSAQDLKTEVPPAAFQEPSMAAPPPPTASSSAPSDAPPPAPPPISRPVSLPPSFTPPPRPPRTRAEWEALIGGQWLNRIGALALIIGVGFFLKYAFENNWFTPAMRVLIGFAIGGGLLLLGARFHKREFRIFAQGLVGAGIAILYLSVYASFNFYHLVSQPVAFVLMSAVTVGTFLQAFRYDSLTVSLLGWAGGFLTPFLLSTGQANEVGLFGYIVLLDVGLLAVLIKKDSWVVLEPLTLGATYLVYAVWNEAYRSPDEIFVTLLFVSIFWGLFYALDVYRAVRAITTAERVRHAVAALNAGFYFVSVYGLINPPYHQWMGAVTLAMGAVYFATALDIKRRRHENVLTRARLGLTAIGLLLLATAIQFSDFVTVACWSLEALLLVWCGLHWKQRYVWQVALGIFGLAVVYLLRTHGALEYWPIQDFRLMFNPRALAFLALAATLGASTTFFARSDEQDRAPVQAALHGSWCVLLFMLVTVETNDYFRKLMLNATGRTTFSPEFIRFITLTTIWMGYSLLLTWYGLRRRASPILYSGLGALILAVAWGAVNGVAFEPMERFTPVLNLRFLVLVFIVLGLLVHAQWLKSKGQDYAWIGTVSAMLGVASVLIIFELITVETKDYFDKAIRLSNWPLRSTEMAIDITRLRNLQQLALSAVWLLYSIGLMVVGIWRRTAALRIMAIILFGITIVKIFVYDLSFLETLYRIFSFIGLGLILLIVSYLYQRYKAIIFEGTSRIEN
jgi:uncharacterized membrane protein